MGLGWLDGGEGLMREHCGCGCVGICLHPAELKDA